MLAKATVVSASLFKTVFRALERQSWGRHWNNTCAGNSSNNCMLSVITVILRCTFLQWGSGSRTERIETPPRGLCLDTVLIILPGDFY